MSSLTCLQGKGTADFFSLVGSLTDRDHLYALIAYNAAPTLMDEKPSNLLTFSKNRKDLLSAWRLYGHEVCSLLGLSFTELRTRPDSAVVLFYKPEALVRTVRGHLEAALLSEMGYPPAAGLKDHLRRLAGRYEHSCPHEIGIFLGIPVEDIRGFIQHRGENCKLCRYWKVYHDPCRATALFDRFDRARSTVEAVLTRRFSTASPGHLKEAPCH